MNLMAHTGRYVASVRFVALNVCLCAFLMGFEGRSERETAAGEPQLVIDRLILGSIYTNCYCLRASRAAKDCVIIDTGADYVAPLTDFLQKYSLRPAAAVFTHGHFDHVNGVTLLCKHFADMKSVVHKADAAALADKVEGSKVHVVENDGPVTLAGIKVEVFHTPGHAPGDISLYSESGGVVFTGDVLSAGSVGWTDLEEGGLEELIEVIRKKLLVFPEETVVYPGRCPPTTIGKEKRSNPFLE